MVCALNAQKGDIKIKSIDAKRIKECFFQIKTYTRFFSHLASKTFNFFLSMDLFFLFRKKSCVNSLEITHNNEITTHLDRVE